VARPRNRSEPARSIYAVVEVPEGERNKVHGTTKDVPGVVLDRVLHSNVHYPSDYGFIPQSYYDDEDPSTCFVLVEDQTFPGCVIEARPIALMKMDDDGEQDDKVIAVPEEDPRYDHLQDLEDIPQQELDEIDEFFATYKNLEEGKGSRDAGLGRQSRREKTPSNTRWTCTSRTSRKRSSHSGEAIRSHDISAGVADGDRTDTRR